MKRITCTLFVLLAVATLYAKEPINASNKASQPLLFIENKGQITDQYKQERKDIDFKLDAGSLSIFVGAGQLHYQWYQYTGKPSDTNMQVNAYRMDVQLLGADVNAHLQKEEANSYYENYYSPRLKDGVTAKSYRRMVYKNIYPQIDWVIYTQGQELKYDFIVHKGGNPADIRLQYNGATSKQLKDGAFIATTPMGSITEAAPYSYEAGTKKPIASAYKLQDGVLAFDVRKQDADLVIDPSLVWATYYGGSGWESGGDVVVDDSDNVYTVGKTSSSTNIATTGAFKTTVTGTWDTYIASLSEGCTRLWATYLGYYSVVNAYTYPDNSIAIDTINNCLYVSGLTNVSTGVATTGAHQTSFGGDVDAYLVCFGFNGIRQWSTYYGGSAVETYSTGLATDVAGNVFLMGYTYSADNIATMGTYKTNIPYYNNVYFGGYMVKFNSSGVRQWGTYLYLNYANGGGYWGHVPIATDLNGNVYISGQAFTGYAVGTPGTHKPLPNTASAEGDVWLSKFSASGSFLWGTFYGGKYLDFANSIAVASNGDIYVVGGTRSDTGIATSGTERTVIHSGSGSTGFVARFNNNGNRIWGTYIGDSLSVFDIGLRCVKLYKDRRIFVTGVSFETLMMNGWPGGPNDLVKPGSSGFQPLRNGSSDYVLGMLDTNGLVSWGTFLGGNAGEGGYYDNSCRIALSERYLYMGGGTYSSTGLAYGTSIYQSSISSANQENFIAQIALDTFVQVRQPFNDTVWCQGDSVKVKTKVNFPFRSTNVFTVQLSNANGSFASPTVIGTKTANGNDSVMCFVPRTMSAGNGYRIRIIASAPADTSENNGVNIRIKPLPTGVVASSNAPICATDTLRLSGSSGNTDVTYGWIGVAGFASGVKDTLRAAATTAHTGNYILTVNRQGCIVKDTVYALVKPRPDTPDASSNSPVCSGASINLIGTNNTSGVSYIWNGPAGFSSTLQSPVRTGATTAYTGIYRVYTSLNGCASLYYDSTSVTVYPVTASPVPNANTPLCLGQDLQLGTGSIPGASYVWSGPGGFSSTLQSPIRPSSTFAFAGKYYVQAIVNGCISSPDSIAVTVNAAPNITMYPSPKDSICVGQSVTFVSSTSNTGSSFTRNWYRNNNVIGGAANANYSTATAADGDEYYTTITVYGVCATPYTDTSNIIRMYVLPYLAPSVSITANPNTTVMSGKMINFTATPTNGGNKPGYQWTRNGTNITGATSNIWGASTLSNNDQICVDMTSSYLCPNPKTAKSNCIKVSIESTGIVGVWTGSVPSIYPNPATEKLIIEGVEKGTKIQLYDVVGRVVIKATATATTTELNLAHLIPGNYVLILSTDAGDRMNVKVIKE